MSNLFYIYLACGVLFLLIEMLSITFYGLSVSVACFALAGYVYVTNDPDVTVIHATILVIISGFFAYFLPKWLTPHTKPLQIGIDSHIGQLFRLERVGSDWKVKIDGVDYLVNDTGETSEFVVGLKVRLEGHNAGILKVSVPR